MNDDNKFNDDLNNKNLDNHKLDDEKLNREMDQISEENQGPINHDPYGDHESDVEHVISENLTDEEKRRLLLKEEREDQSRGQYVYKEEPRKKEKRRGGFFSYIAVALIAAIIGGLVSPYIGARLYGNILPEPSVTEYATSPIVINPDDDYTTVSAVAKKSMSSVVGITTIEEVQNFWYMPELVEGLGTGVIVSSNGYILTNSHVIRDGNAKSIHVLLENGEKEEASLLWNEPSLDLAIVKINRTGLPVAELGDSDKLIVGEAAIAIGNPLGLEFQRSVTSGIISGLNRSIQVSENVVIEDLIQTDASINNGNSGGPLLNSRGQVIGINTAKIKSAEGLGFSIPINEAKVIIEQVIENGSFETVFLGISGIKVEDYEMRLGVEVEAEQGLVLVQVGANTPADLAGLLNGDVITKIDDVEVDSMMKLKKTLYRYKKGDKANLLVIRNGREEAIEIEFSQVRGEQ